MTISCKKKNCYNDNQSKEPLERVKICQMCPFKRDHASFLSIAHCIIPSCKPQKQ